MKNKYEAPLRQIVCCGNSPDVHTGRSGVHCPAHEIILLRVRILYAFPMGKARTH